MKTDKTTRAKASVSAAKTSAPIGKIAPTPAVPTVPTVAKASAQLPAKSKPPVPAPVPPAKVPAPAPAAKALAPEVPVAAPRKRTSVKVAATPPTPNAAVRLQPSKREITPDLIAARAYTIWEQQGRPQGRDVANWLLAESQLKEEIQTFSA
jgi:hypothetical protein